MKRNFPIGAEAVSGGTHFRAWAPLRTRVRVALLGGDAQDLEPEDDGYFSGTVPGAVHGTRYHFRLDAEERGYADPASRYQPEGPHGPSQVVDASRFRWTDQNWQGPRIRGEVICEIHIGTFTPAGTWRAAAERLPLLAETGITMVEVMPVADFPGRFGWGYDGVNLWAPCRLYGEADDFRAFVDAAHASGLSVILDVVCNHFGPDGNFIEKFSPFYFTEAYRNEWGKAINFDGERSGPVREFFASNARYWLEEFHLDGLRLDATQQIFDGSPVHVLSEIERAVHGGRSRKTFLVAENEEQQSQLIRPREVGGFGLDALWNDDLHHSAVVALTGRREAYYSDYEGSPQELISAIRWGFLYQGQRYGWQKQQRGSASLDIPAHRFVSYLENHDQLANSARGERVWQQSVPGAYRAMIALLLLGPGTPLLFQGQEFGSSAPFLFFADHEPELAQKVAAGRKEFLSQFVSFATEETGSVLADPASRDTFERCRLDWSERDRHSAALALHRDLIRLRGEHPFSEQNAERIHGAVLSPRALALRFLYGGESDALLIVNLGPSSPLDPVPQPLLAPPAGCHWEIAFSTEAPEYGGSGTAPLDGLDGWRLPGQAAVVLRPKGGSP